MFISVIIIGLLLYGSFKLMPHTWELIPELISNGDSIMAIGFFSCIVAAIIAMLIVFFKYFDSCYYAMSTFLLVCLIAIGINSYIIINDLSYDPFRAIVCSLIFQLQFAIPIGIITYVLCACIHYTKKS